MNLTEAIQSVDMDEVIDRMTAYAYIRLKTFEVKNLEGKEPVDFVGDVILKVMDGERNWENANCSFEEFLFGSLKSEISNFFKSKKPIFSDELPITRSNDSQNFDEERKLASEILEEKGADDDELLVFECWMDGINKPKEIAKELGIDVKSVYNISKRLKRSLEALQTELKKIL